MSWVREVIASPEGLASALAELEPPERKGELAQFEAAIAAVPAIAAGVSKREPMLVTLSGHTDPNAEGFDPRTASISVSRIEPDDAKRRAEEKRKEAEELEAAAEAASTKAEEAAAAAQRAEEEAGATPDPSA